MHPPAGATGASDARRPSRREVAARAEDETVQILRDQASCPRPPARPGSDTNTGTVVAQASDTMFTESGEQAMRSAQASRPA